MYSIAKAFSFSASHRLTGLPDDHPCSRLHGHNYVVELEMGGNLDAVGFVIDYRALDPFKKFIDTNLDHRDLNEVFAIRGEQNQPINPTAENIARYLFDCAVNLFPNPYLKDGQPTRATRHGVIPNWYVRAVRVRETDKTVAEYRP